MGDLVRMKVVGCDGLDGLSLHSSARDSIGTDSGGEFFARRILTSAAPLQKRDIGIMSFFFFDEQRSEPTFRMPSEDREPPAVAANQNVILEASASAREFFNDGCVSHIFAHRL